MSQQTRYGVKDFSLAGTTVGAIVLLIISSYFTFHFEYWQFFGLVIGFLIIDGLGKVASLLYDILLELRKPNDRGQ